MKPTHTKRHHDAIARFVGTEHSKTTHKPASESDEKPKLHGSGRSWAPKLHSLDDPTLTGGLEVAQRAMIDERRKRDETNNDRSAVRELQQKLVKLTQDHSSERKRLSSEIDAMRTSNETHLATIARLERELNNVNNERKRDSIRHAQELDELEASNREIIRQSNENKHTNLDRLRRERNRARSDLHNANAELATEKSLRQSDAEEAFKKHEEAEGEANRRRADHIQAVISLNNGQYRPQRRDRQHASATLERDSGITFGVGAKRAKTQVHDRPRPPRNVQHRPPRDCDHDLETQTWQATLDVESTSATHERELASLNHHTNAATADIGRLKQTVAALQHSSWHTKYEANAKQATIDNMAPQKDAFAYELSDMFGELHAEQNARSSALAESASKQAIVHIFGSYIDSGIIPDQEGRRTLRRDLGGSRHRASKVLAQIASHNHRHVSTHQHERMLNANEVETRRLNAEIAELRRQMERGTTRPTQTHPPGISATPPSTFQPTKLRLADRLPLAYFVTPTSPSGEYSIGQRHTSCCIECLFVQSSVKTTRCPSLLGFRSNRL